ncbi:MAG TPA: DUF6438 domain-containing protein [Flavitalea sp.]|nr:DUF6438 domain-containing protein [Flavitalea sp.]
MAARLNISTIHFEAGGCLGECPIFSLTIYSNGTVIYHASMFNEKQGIFLSIIPKRKLARLTKAISDSVFFHLEDGYEAPCTCMPTYILEVTLIDGQTKRIEDYGPYGPYELQLLYKRMFRIRESHQWD